MASPQTENGYTKIANEIMEALARNRLSGQERQIVDVVLRKTYGFNKKEDVISMGQFSKLTGINRPLVARLLKSLLHKMILRVTQKDNTKGNSYIFQKDFEKWKVLHKKITVTQKDNTPVTQNDNKSVTQNDTYKRKKETLTKERRGKPQTTPIPLNFTISDRVKKWAKEKGYDPLEEHLESFKRKVAAKGYRYIDWDSAFMEAIREDWAKLRTNKPQGERLSDRYKLL